MYRDACLQFINRPKPRAAVRLFLSGTAVSLAAIFQIGILVTTTQPARAGSWLASDSPLELRLDRHDDRVQAQDTADRRNTDVTGSTGSSDYEKDLQLRVILPFVHSSSVVGANSDSLVAGSPDNRFSPDVSLKWSHQYRYFRASAEIGVSMDIFQTFHDADSEVFYTAGKLEWTDGKSDLFVPYAAYSHSTYFVPTFKSTDIIYNDVALGFSSGIGVRNGRLIEYSDAGNPGDVSFNFDARGGRRMADYLDYENTFMQASFDFEGILTNEWKIEAGTKGRVRWYNDYFGEKRRDVRLGWSLGLVWSPVWLTTMVKRSHIAFNVIGYRNISTVEGNSYSLVEFGPELSFKTKF